MHPHGVRYTPDYDGVYLGEHTRVGGFVAPGEEFTYTWEATPDSVGVWPYHDHGPNHTLNTFRGAFGAIVIRERGAKVARRRAGAVPAPAAAAGHRACRARSRRSTAARPRATRRRSRRASGQDVALHVIGMDNNFHDFHIHGHRWKDAAGAFVDTPTRGAERDDHGALRRGQSGPLALPLPCLLAPGRGHGGLVHGEPLRRRSTAGCDSAPPPSPRSPPGCSSRPARSRRRRATRSPRTRARSCRSRRARARPARSARRAASSGRSSRPSTSPRRATPSGSRRAPTARRSR